MKGRESGMGNRESPKQHPCESAASRLFHDSRFPIPYSQPRVRRLARGFTLIELIAVIVLLAIAMTVVSVSFSKSLSSAKVRGASRDLVAALRYTRGQAIVKGEPQVLSMNLESNAYTAPGKPEVRLP